MAFKAHAGIRIARPQPLSITCTSASPASCGMSFISVAPASTAFPTAPLLHSRVVDHFTSCDLVGNIIRSNKILSGTINFSSQKWRFEAIAAIGFLTIFGKMRTQHFSIGNKALAELC
jgi:hypothetical protein